MLQSCCPRARLALFFFFFIYKKKSLASEIDLGLHQIDLGHS